MACQEGNRKTKQSTRTVVLYIPMTTHTHDQMYDANAAGQIVVRACPPHHTQGYDANAVQALHKGFCAGTAQG